MAEVYLRHVVLEFLLGLAVDVLVVPVLAVSVDAHLGGVPQQRTLVQVGLESVD